MSKVSFIDRCGTEYRGPDARWGRELHVSFGCEYVVPDERKPMRWISGHTLKDESDNSHWFKEWWDAEAGEWKFSSMWWGYTTWNRRDLSAEMWDVAPLEGLGNGDKIQVISDGDADGDHLELEIVKLGKKSLVCDAPNRVSHALLDGKIVELEERSLSVGRTIRNWELKLWAPELRMTLMVVNKLPIRRRSRIHRF